MIQKLRAVEEALRLIRDKELREVSPPSDKNKKKGVQETLKPIDMVVLVYLTSNLDNGTGETVRRLATIAEGCGVDRQTAWRSLRRLKVFGLITVRERHYESPTGVRPRSRLANAYQLGAPGSYAALPTGHRQPGLRMVSPLLHIPNGQARQDGGGGGIEPVDWNAEAKWIAEKGRTERGNRYSLDETRQFLDNLRAQRGDTAMAYAIRNARRLYGPNLIDFLSRTWPEKQRRQRGGAP